MVVDGNPSMMQDQMDIDCFRQLEVLNPEIRDQLADKIENATGEENKFLILLHLKK